MLLTHTHTRRRTHIHTHAHTNTRTHIHTHSSGQALRNVTSYICCMSSVTAVPHSPVSDSHTLTCLSLTHPSSLLKKQYTHPEVLCCLTPNELNTSHTNICVSITNLSSTHTCMHTRIHTQRASQLGVGLGMGRCQLLSDCLKTILKRAN